MCLITTLLNSPIILLVSFTIVMVTVLINYKKRINNVYWSRKNVTVAHMPSMVKILIKKLPIHELERELVNKHGKIFGTHHFGKPTLFCADPELLSCVMSKDFTTFTNRRTITSYNDISINMLSYLKDDDWKRVRSIVSPAFSSGKLRKMKPMIDECLETLIKDFDSLIKDNNELDVIKAFGAFAMNVIASVAFGVKLDALTDENNPIITYARSFLNYEFNLIEAIKFLIQNRSIKLAKFLKLNNLKLNESKFFSDFALKLIEERKSNNAYKSRNDFLDLLLEALNIEKELDKGLEDDDTNEFSKFTSTNKTMSPIEIAAQCVVFFVAGYDSATTTLSYCAYNLACNPNIQQLLYEEAKNVLENNNGADYDLINSLKYTDAVVSETLRLFAPAFAINRVASDDYVLGDGIKLSKGDIVHIPIYAIHKDPDNFPEPEMFKPERFFPENRTHHPYAYLPFGAGPRNCVAQRFVLNEIKVALLYSVYNFRFSVTDKTEHPPKLEMGLVIKPKQILLKVEKR